MDKSFLVLLMTALVATSAWADPTATATANGGMGGAGGAAMGGAASGGSATGGAATGNASNVMVSVANGGGGADGSGGGTPTTINYGGSYTVRTTPAIAAPSLTSTFSDTCMGSSSFGVSMVGFGATGGTTMVDDACVRRLDSREFRAMGMEDVALALLCQSAANQKAVEATGRSCPGKTVALPALPSATPADDEYSDPFVRRRLGLAPLTTDSAKQAGTTAVSSLSR